MPLTMVFILVCSLEAIGEPPREHYLCALLNTGIWGDYGAPSLALGGRSTCPETQRRDRSARRVFRQRARNIGIVRRRTLSRSATRRRRQRATPRTRQPQPCTARGHSVLRRR